MLKFGGVGKEDARSQKDPQNSKAILYDKTMLGKQISPEKGRAGKKGTELPKIHRKKKAVISI